MLPHFIGVGTSIRTHEPCSTDSNAVSVSVAKYPFSTNPTSKAELLTIIQLRTCTACRWRMWSWTPPSLFSRTAWGTLSTTADTPAAAYELCNFIYTIFCLNDKFNSSLKELIHCNAAHASKSLALLTYEKGNLVLNGKPVIEFCCPFRRFHTHTQQVACQCWCTASYPWAVAIWWSAALQVHPTSSACQGHA